MDAEPTCGHCGKPLSEQGKSLAFCDPPKDKAEETSCQAKWARARLEDATLWTFPYEEFTGFVPTDAFVAAEAAARKRLTV